MNTKTQIVNTTWQDLFIKIILHKSDSTCFQKGLSFSSAINSTTCLDVISVFSFFFSLFFSESDTAAVYSAGGTEDISYGQIVIKENQNKPKMRGTAAPLCFHHGSLQQSRIEALF